jgi:hypothetical protein
VGAAPFVKGVVHEGCPLEQHQVIRFGQKATFSNGKKSRTERVARQVLRDIGGMDMRASRVRARSPPNPKSSIITSKLHLPPRWVNSASGASNDRPPPAAAFEST